MSGGFGNKRGPQTAEDYERTWNIFVGGLGLILVVGFGLYVAFS